MAFTFFFRDLQTLDLLTTNILPRLKGRLHIDIWDAGCAMGPEPYTLAILLREQMSHFLFRNVRVFATDIDEQNEFGPIIQKGVYNHDMLKRIPANLFQEYFQPCQEDSGCYRIREDLRRTIRFQKHDLLTLKPIRNHLGVILCKNVLLHFSHQQRVDVIRMFHSALAEDGYLVTERTQLMPPEVAHLFKPLMANAQIYQKLPEIDRAACN